MRCCWRKCSREEQVLEYADLRSTAFGSFYMNGYPTLTAKVARYLWMLGTQMVVWVCVPVFQGEVSLL
jgi:hypothetical protein